MADAEEVQDVTFEEDQTVEDPEASIMTLDEVLQYEDEIAEDTAAVLGAMNDKCCSYAEGYIKRQALYSCVTCVPEASTDPEKRAGVCLACSYLCHDGHDLIELYTKRNFRCDCGNSKFGEIKCNLLPDKDTINEDNNYNQNFTGTYCICNRPYPDLEDPVSDEMIQCIVCEDWYHSRHLNVSLPLAPFVEMICFNCVGDHEFLLHYAGSAESKVPDVSENQSEAPQEESVNVEVSEEVSDVLPQDETPVISDCKKPKNKSEPSTLFFPDITWRNRLCTCDTCLEIYGDENVIFLIDPEDPVQIYEEKGKVKTQEILDNTGKEILGSMNRVQLIETIAGYNEFKENLSDFFKDFAEKKRIIREEDVKDFFEQMHAKKKQKMEMNYYCK